MPAVTGAQNLLFNFNDYHLTQSLCSRDGNGVP